MVAVPEALATAVTSPVEELTVAIPVALEVQAPPLVPLAVNWEV